MQRVPHASSYGISGPAGGVRRAGLPEDGPQGRPQGVPERSRRAALARRIEVSKGKFGNAAAALAVPARTVRLSKPPAVSECVNQSRLTPY